MKVWAPMTKKIAEMEAIAKKLPSEAEKKAFWAKVKADPKNIAEWKAMDKKAKTLFKEDKKTWETNYVAHDKKEGKWLTFLSLRKFGTRSEVSKNWKRSDQRKFSFAWSNKKGESAATYSMELMMSDNAMALAASATFALSALTLI